MNNQTLMEANKLQSQISNLKVDIEHLTASLDILYHVREEKSSKLKDLQNKFSNLFPPPPGFNNDIGATFESNEGAILREADSNKSKKLI